MTADLPSVKLDIISDPICPWCYIGKTHLDKALAETPEHPFVIEWHPFQLNPDMPREGMDRRAYLEAKFGGKEGAVRAYAPVVEHAEKAGLSIDFEGMQRTPNTIDAHRLIHWAGIEGKQGKMVDALFDAYFAQARDIGDSDVLVEIAAKIGMEADVVRQLLSGNNDVEDIRKRDAHSRQMGVSSVPTFIIANQHAVPGAQQPDMWKQVIEDIMQQLQSTEGDT
ncbi:MAG: polyketide biosynthesis protein [Roseobacter sp. MedPE-SWde]|nr:MAG: polyketide biosynthesis protein [Roseobacter sp. MedPE-SWde]